MADDAKKVVNTDFVIKPSDTSAPAAESDHSTAGKRSLCRRKAISDPTGFRKFYCSERKLVLPFVIL